MASARRSGGPWPSGPSPRIHLRATSLPVRRSRALLTTPSAPSPSTSNTSNSSMLLKFLHRGRFFASPARGSWSGAGRLRAAGATTAAAAEDMVSSRLGERKKRVPAIWACGNGIETRAESSESESELEIGECELRVEMERCDWEKPIELDIEGEGRGSRSDSCDGGGRWRGSRTQLR
ncbi:hypothetical protein BDA96_10G140100 [Sorghum bicolor]|uniref:Uncharacterized protein n=1 Tax=Sorghum bicolor TaxID=4558 RepID=A0A921U0M3_SORBI|nr:hypothetical protein BDA96_10G140100 [Sorghum bicolor]